jgi:hypothetical protein
MIECEFGGTATAMDKQQTEAILRRLFKGGVLEWIPRNSDDAAVVLALAASSLDPQRTYPETEVNEQLLDWMGSFCGRSLDHVTIRRCLVDDSFLLRDSAGASYAANQAVINTVIEPAARSIRPQEIFDEVQLERARRKRAALS